TQNKFSAQLIRRFMSYYQAEEKCTNLRLGTVFKHQSENTKNCIAVAMGILDLDTFYKDTEKNCYSINFIAMHQCIDSKYNKRIEKFVGNSDLVLKDINIDLYNDQNNIPIKSQKAKQNQIQFSFSANSNSLYYVVTRATIEIDPNLSGVGGRTFRSEARSL